MAWTQTDIDKLKAAIASGAKSVQFSDGRQVVYHSLDEMMKALAAMEGAVAQSTSGRRTLASFTRG